MRSLFLFLLIVTLTAGLRAQESEEVKLASDLSSEAIPFPHYWKSTGFSPSDLIDYPDMQMTLNYLKASGAIEWMRPHYLLDHVKVRNFGTAEQSYDWSALDSKLQILIDNDLKLIYEIMGNPLDREVDFADSVDLYGWKNLVRDMAIHLMDEFGEEVVKSWWFESTNEPDIRFFWSEGYIKYLNYYDACSEGLLEADPEITFGGPGSVRDHNFYFQLLLEHCAYGINYFTRKEGSRIDFITIHRKDDPYDMVEREVETWKFMMEKFPQYQNLPLGNDEADPIAGWGTPYYWRTGPWYAAFIAQSVELHNRMIIDSLGLNYANLSNDHGFLGSWGKRTQLARFIPGDNDAETEGASGDTGIKEAGAEGSAVRNFYLIKQPALTVMTLMALLGDERFAVEGLEDEQRPNIGAMVTREGKGKIAAIVYNKPEIDLKSLNWKPTMTPPEDHQKALSSQGAQIKLNLRSLPKGKYKLVHYRIDEDYNNPYATWEKLGSPEDPTMEDYLTLSREMEPNVFQIKDVKIDKSGVWEETIDFPTSAVSLLVMAQEGEEPKKITGLQAKIYAGLNEEDMVMLNWDHGSTSELLTYEVEMMAPKGDTFEKINPADFLSAGFAYPLEDATGYQFRVRAVDYWGRKGDYSEVMTISQ